MFPENRMRRLRRTANIRAINTEIRLHTDDLIYPMFVIEGENIKNEIPSMPGIYQYSIDKLLSAVAEAVSYGIKAIIFFGLPAVKDEIGSQAYACDGIIQRAVRAVRKEFPDLVILTDVCLCEYTSHGHCGLVSQDGRILNDPTLELLAKTAVSHAEAGADIVAPSDFMDGRVGAIRQKLDANGFEDVAVMSYAVKYASAYYGPFREAAGSAPQFGDRKTYQMDPASGIRQAMAEAELDVLEGADYLIVKPALAYMDVIAKARETFDQPIVAYNVSGEYAMIKAAAINGWIDEKKIVLETMIGLKRAGSDMIMTYHALDIAKWLREGH